MDNLEWLKNLMIMAAADHKLTDEEMEYLENRAAQLNVDSDEYAAALAYASDEEATLTLPADHGERLRMLRELIHVMAIDGELHDIEKTLFAVAAAHMEVSDHELAGVLDSLR